MNSFLQFWSAWLRGPHRVGAVAPSSPALARAMTEAVDPAGEGLVVELGAGTGAITRHLCQAFNPDQLLIIERDAQLAQHLRRQYPEYSVLTADARHLVNALQGRPCRAVVSALPLLSLPEDDRSAIIAAISDAIGERGQLIQFTYGLGTPVPTKDCQTNQLSGHRQRYILWNLPPATVWEYRRKPVGKQDSAGSAEH